MKNSPSTSAEIESNVKRIAIQGETGSYHEIAARQFFGNHIQLECCDSFPELFKNLGSLTSDFAVSAIENSVAGTILPNYGLLRESGFHIIGEVYLRISHMLMALPGTKIEDLKEVHSHPMAIAQCHRFLDTLPNIRLVECDDTAASARRIAENKSPHVAAIASTLAASHYNMSILAQAIEDDPGNFTRFFILSRSESDLIKQPDKASLCFAVGHEVGQLSKVLMILSAHGMNLTKIQSSPIVGKAWEYFFHLDLEFSAYDQYQRAIDSIRSLVKDLTIIGEYPKAHKTPEALTQ